MWKVEHDHHQNQSWNSVICVVRAVEIIDSNIGKTIGFHVTFIQWLKNGVSQTEYHNDENYNKIIHQHQVIKWFSFEVFIFAMSGSDQSHYPKSKNKICGTACATSVSHI